MEKEKQLVKLPYITKIDVTYQTYKKALYDCIAEVTEVIKNSAVFQSADVPEYVQLVNMLNGQLMQVNAFLNDYKQVDEAI